MATFFWHGWVLWWERGRVGPLGVGMAPAQPHKPRPLVRVGPTGVAKRSFWICFFFLPCTCSLPHRSTQEIHAAPRERGLREALGGLDLPHPLPHRPTQGPCPLLEPPRNKNGIGGRGFEGGGQSPFPLPIS